MTADSVYTRITDACEILVRLMERLQAEIPQKPSHRPSAGGMPQGGHGPLASWHTAAANLFFEIHAGTRELETNVRYSLSGHIRTRGGSDKNTARAIEGLPSLVAGCDYAGAQIVARKLENWAFRAKLILDDIEPLARLPRLPGQSEPRCPWCSKTTLRYRPHTGIVRCLNPTCRDGDGRQPEGVLEAGAYSGEPSLSWSDGTTGVAVA